MKFERIYNGIVYFFVNEIVIKDVKYKLYRTQKITKIIVSDKKEILIEETKGEEKIKEVKDGESEWDKLSKMKDADKQYK